MKEKEDSPEKERETGYGPYGLYTWTLVLLAVMVLAMACKRDEEVAPDSGIDPEIRSVNNFIWDNMDVFYLWREFMPPGVDPDTEPEPPVFFDKLLYKAEDRWSFITDDYEGLVNRLSGIETTFGHQFKLFRESGSGDIFGVVEYVIRQSPAEQADIRRGDVFVTVDGIGLDTLNYRELLFNRESYTLGFADMVDGEVSPNGETAELTAVEIQEDPLLLDTVFETEGRKIAYLVYTRFLSDFDGGLRSVFEGFKSAGAEDLIIDLRYNPGGSVSTAALMASLIAPATVVNDEAVFSRYIWNDIVEQYWLDQHGEDSQNLVVKFSPEEANLDMSRVYFIVSENSASASETVINGLIPYLDVTLIGQTTHGKYTGSITLHDQEESFNWAIQPIVLKTANVDGNTEFREGFAPDLLEEDDLFSPLGSTDERMLARALSEITGVPSEPVARKALPGAMERAMPFLSGGRRPVDERKIQYIDNVEVR